jgi:hypothetical protein
MGMQAARYIFVLVVIAGLPCMGQSITNASIWQDLIRLETDQTLTAPGKLQLMYQWKKQAEATHLPMDSVYARLLHKIGVYEFYTGKRYNVALQLTQQALRINTSGKAGSSQNLATTDLFNIAQYCDGLSLLKKALIYYDSAILFARRGPDIEKVIPDSWLYKANVYFRMGDYEKTVEESDRARTYSIQNRDSFRLLLALNQRAQALFFQGSRSAAQVDSRSAIALARALHEDFELGSALKSQALVLAQLREFKKAETFHFDCIAARIRSKQFSQVSGDYVDLGNFYSDTMKAFQKATAAYRQAMQYARKEKDSIKMAQAAINLGRNYDNQGDQRKAIPCYAQAMEYLKIGRGADITLNPTARELGAIGNKETIQSLFSSKTQLLLRLYRQTREPGWLNACLRTALLNDSLIRDIRHEQLGEQSKLYWRDKTRSFFLNALEACYLANDSRLAFFFMEESRSVLLQDKLNELGAHAYLPPAEAAKEDDLRITIIELQKKLGALSDTSGQGRAVLQQLLAAKEALEEHIHSLEKNYPAYYQYKYADDVKPLSSLQAFLANNKQDFVDYFIEDTLCFALCVQPHNARFLRIFDKGPGIEDQLVRMITLCSDENALNRDYPAFLSCANNLYNLLLEPFHLAPGRVIICQDNHLVPFEALSTNPSKAEFLIRNYSFSYVYSARSLMHHNEQTPGKGDFLGIAPVNFSAYNGLADLKLSEAALLNCSERYTRRKLLLHADASRQNFIRQVCNYNTITILTHARADSAGDEPILFLNDSVIHLSELQFLNKPAARLIVLSACQTNVGRNRNGEGIFSLARGFSAAGIPAVAATQWMADELAIYAISQRFNEFISRGMNKDDALQQAKLFYIDHDKAGSPLPCYWADMILIGNTEPIAFSQNPGFGWVIPVILLSILVGAFYAIRKFTSPSSPPATPAR